MSEYDLVHAALSYFAKNHTPGVDIFACASSDPYFGLKHHPRFDRLNVAFKFQNNQVEIQCQIVFDSSDYTFVPDIIVDPEWHQLADPELLPTEWPIHEEDCLSRWLKSLWSNFNRQIFGDELEDGDEEHDELLSSCQSSVVQVQSPTTTPVATPAPELSSEIGDLMDQVTFNEPYSTPIVSLSDQEEECTMDVESRSPIERRAFIEQWISTMPNHVIRFDADHYESIALYLTVKIPDDMWSEMQVYQRKSINDLGGTSQGKGTIGRPKNNAPAIVQLKMRENFPNTPLAVTIISAINSDQENKSEPEVMQFDMTMNPQWTLDDMCRKVQEALVEEIPKFHSGFFASDST